VRMPFRDGQYLDSPSISRLAAALEETIYRSTANTLVMPLGLHHADHALVYDACCEILPYPSRRLPEPKLTLSNPDRRHHLVERDRQVTHPDASGVINRVRQRGHHTGQSNLANPAHPE
jgi:hypothetical protein